MAETQTKQLFGDDVQAQLAHIEDMYRRDRLTRGDADDAIAELNRETRRDKMVEELTSFSQSALVNETVRQLNEHYHTFLETIETNRKLFEGIPLRPGAKPKEGLDRVLAVGLNDLSAVMATWGALFSVMQISTGAAIAGATWEKTMLALGLDPGISRASGRVVDFGVSLLGPTFVTRSFTKLVQAKATAELASKKKALDTVIDVAKSDARLTKGIKTLEQMGIEFELGPRILAPELAKAADEAGARIAAAFARGATNVSGRSASYRVETKDGKVIIDRLNDVQEKSHVALMQKHGINSDDVVRSGFDVEGQFVSMGDSLVREMQRSLAAGDIIRTASNTALKNGTRVADEVKKLVDALPETSKKAQEPFVTLYRGEATPGAGSVPDWIKQGIERSGAIDAQGRWFTTDKKIAEWYKNDAGKTGRIVTIRVPESVAEAARVTKNPEALKFSRDPANEFFLSKKDVLTGQSEAQAPTAQLTREFLAADDDIALLLKGIDPPVNPIPKTFRDIILNIDKFSDNQRRNMSIVYTEYLKRRGKMTVADVLKVAPGTTKEAEGLLSLFGTVSPIVRDYTIMAKALAQSGDSALAQRFMDVTPQVLGLNEIVLGVRTESGRSLSVFNEIVGKYHGQFSEAIQSSLAKTMLKSGISETKASIELAKDVAKFSDEFDTAVALTKLNQAPELMPRIQELYRSILMLSLSTATRNLVGSAIGTTSAALERTVGRVIGVGSPKDVLPALEESRIFAEAMSFSLGRNFKLLRGIWDESFLRDALSKTDTFGNRVEAFTHEIPGLGGRLVRTGTRATISVDAINQRMIRDAWLYTEGSRAAQQAKLVGKQAEDFITEFVNFPSAKIEAAALSAAKQYSFTAPLGWIGQMLQKGLQAGPMFFLFPFFRTPVNLTKFAVERTPLGFFSSRLQTELASSDPARVAQAQGTLFMGQLYFAAFWEMAVSGQITGTRPLNESAAALQKQAGITDRSLNIRQSDGTTLQIPSSSFEPISSTLVAIADTAQAVSYARNETEAMTAVTAAALAVVAGVENNTWLRNAHGVFNVIEAARKGTIFTIDTAAKLIGTPVTSIITPPFIAQAARGLDDVQRDDRTFTERILVRTPWGSKDVEPESNVFGESYLRPMAWGGPVAEALLPMIRVRPEADRELDYLRKLGVSVPGRTVSIFGDPRPTGALANVQPETNFGTPLSDDDDRAIKRQRGNVRLNDKSLREHIGALIDESEADPTLGLPTQRVRAEGLINAFHKRAEIDWATANPEALLEVLQAREQQGFIHMVDPEQRPVVIEGLRRAREAVSQRFNEGTLQALIPELFSATENQPQKPSAP